MEYVIFFIRSTYAQDVAGPTQEDATPSQENISKFANLKQLEYLP
jgi:hypothetical protein